MKKLGIAAELFYFDSRVVDVLKVHSATQVGLARLEHV